MTDAPLISVIVPVYNCGQFIGECIDSILNQSYHNLELLIIDDGSTDNTIDIIKQFDDSRIRFFKQANSGPSKARNLGLDNVRGEFVTFVDADDYLSYDCIEILFMLLSETEADISAAAFTRDASRLALLNERYYTLDAKGYLSDVLYQRSSDNSVCGKLYKTSLWNNVRFRDMRFEDLEVFPRVCLNAVSVTVTEAKLYFYRPNADSFINVFSTARLDALIAVDMIIDYLQKTNCHDDLVRAARSRKLAASFNIILITAGRPEYVEVRQNAWNNIKSLRKSCFIDVSVIPKIKFGILASFAGPKALQFINSIVRVSK